MPVPARVVTATVTRILICLLAIPTAAFSQTQTQSRDQTEVIRVFTELIQTDVLVFDKDGHFKDNLRREDFELRIDGKVKPIEFFERVAAGSANEETQIAAARGSVRVGTKGKPVPLDRGRTVLFYVDDLHLDLAGAKAARRVITRFIDAEMSQNDEAAVTSASGQLGFLQQITDNKTVLRRALERLTPQPYRIQDQQQPPMSEFQALRIDGFDRDVTGFYVDAVRRENPMISQQTAEAMVQSRASQILTQAAHITRSSLVGLESLVRSASALPGQKLLFFLSNGFFVNDSRSDVRDRLQRITSAAARNGVVIYSLDARGLVSALIDASTDAPFDPSFRLRRSESAEITASQDGLHSLAYDTGGRTIFNTNDLGPGLKKALDETSVYYLLAWKPDQDKPSSSKFRRIEVKLINKPDLVTRVRRGFFDLEPPAAAAVNDQSKKTADKKAESELWKAIAAAMPNQGLPFSLSLTYIDTPEKGPLLSTAMQVPSEFLTFNVVDGKSRSVVELAGAIFNDKGQVGARLNQRLTVTAPPPDASVPPPKNFSYTFPIHLAPGLYQGRFGVRDVTSGKTGTAHAWIEIPPLVPGEVQLSSLHIGERTSAPVTNASVSPDSPIEGVSLSIDHYFRSSSYLRFLVFVYNAARASDAKPDLALQVLLLRDGQPVVTTPLKKLTNEGAPDLNRIPYAAEISLADLPSGRYLLKVNVIDRVSKRSASQETPIEIE
ncbi:MAG TPA: VWA domain-containing protein [Pyrinomonadaceae bacterium]|nr:VWA domain-containing protein [Pyrinomonadaceae bacterium]